MEFIMAHYVCIENNEVTSILNYEPNVPGNIVVRTITDTEAQQIYDGTHYYNIGDENVQSLPQSEIDAQAQVDANGTAREFLNNTDWKVLRHIREKALNITTTLTEAEYLSLEQQRQTISESIVE